MGHESGATRTARGRIGDGLRALLLTALLCVAAHADDGPAATRTEEVGIWGGGSVASSTAIGSSTDFDFGLAALRYGRMLWSNGTLSFDWTIDAIPLALISLDRAAGTPAATGDRELVYGAGLAPIGFRIDYEGLGRVRPYFAASGGFLYFTERIPATGVKFNFTYDFGVGAQLFLDPSQALTFGYKYHHISNGGIGDSNPGFDSNILYAGFSIYR